MDGRRPQSWRAILPLDPKGAALVSTRRVRLTRWVLRLFSLIVFVSRREIGSYCHLVSTGRDTFLSMAWASSPVSLLWATFQLTSTSIVLAQKAWDGGLGTRSAGTALCLSPKPLSPTCKVRHGKGPWHMPESFCDWC